MSKYHAKKVTADGMTFDSKKEYQRWKELSLLQRAGKISGLKRQVEFELIPAQFAPDTFGIRGGRIPGKCLERKLSYIADFVYLEPISGIETDEFGNAKFYDGYETIVEDVKGYKKGTAYSVFSIKRKLMLYFHGIRIREV